MNATKELIHLFTYKKRLVYFADKFLGASEWSEDFTMEALDKARNQEFENEDELKNFLYQRVRDSCLSYLRVFDPEKEFTNDQMQGFFNMAELMEEIKK